MPRSFSGRASSDLAIANDSKASKESPPQASSSATRMRQKLASGAQLYSALLSPRSANRLIFARRFSATRVLPFLNKAQQLAMTAETDASPSVADLSVHTMTSEVPQYPNCFPSVNPVDKYRVHIAELIAQTLDLNPELVYPKLQCPSSANQGDLILAVCAFYFSSNYHFYP